MNREDALNHNLAEFMERGPGLRYSTQKWIAARDDTNGYVLLSGLGGMGIGTMWSKRYDGDKYETYPGWGDAPILITEDAQHGERRIIKGDETAAHARTAAGMMQEG